MADFDQWSRENLIQIAKDATEQNRVLREELEVLRQERDEYKKAWRLSLQDTPK